MATVTPAAAAHYRRMQQLQVLAVAMGRRAWDHVDEKYLIESWQRISAQQLAPALAPTLRSAAEAGATYGVMDMAQRDTYVEPVAFVRTAGFGSTAPSGVPLEVAIASPMPRVLGWIGDGHKPAEALQMGRSLIDGMMRTFVADTGRLAASVDITTRPRVGWVRMLNPPSCSSCTILAGRFYRWNQGFRRHPKCDCIHRPVGSLDAAKSEGLIDDPYEYFHGLSKKEQDQLFGAGNAQAIRDGGDIYQVVNSKRGLRNAMTTEGTTRAGYASKLLRPGQKRMTPDTIYRVNTSREDAIADLRAQGYILPAGQVAGGSIRGANYQGFGALGRGGTRKAASEAVVTARETGVRDANTRYTMTEAERRLYDARNRYEIALSGRSPYTSPGFGSTPDPTGAGLNRVGAGYRAVTSTELAQAELDYRRWLESGGAISTS